MTDTLDVATMDIGIVIRSTVHLSLAFPSILVSCTSNSTASSDYEDTNAAPLAPDSDQQQPHQTHYPSAASQHAEHSLVFTISKFIDQFLQQKSELCLSEAMKTCLHDERKRNQKYLSTFQISSFINHFKIKGRVFINKASSVWLQHQSHHVFRSSMVERMQGVDELSRGLLVALSSSAGRVSEDGT
ncbi:hypothetical protein Nepgr_010527 [Nepenthes gracilis]|uniref:Uncharacterized protein n=1 Tax=Nepenthes gracilis TaxID=150966 RepID=A0AAD3SDL3_NEPGR|nr:hypothetical protein Nepgr_010527 [Nepenthes gracilis]